METPCLCPSEGHKYGGRNVTETLACVASVSVQFGSKELQGDEWRGRKEGNACRQTPGF